MTNHKRQTLLGLIVAAMTLASCISTDKIADGDQLFAGLKKIDYVDSDADVDGDYRQHLEETKAEVEAALATAPNGALFGSSYYRLPFSWRLWAYNRFSGKSSKLAQWMTKSFGKPPVLMSTVNPALRASVAQSVLRANGYFRAGVHYEAVTGSNPKKARIAYHVSLDSLFTIDSVAYMGYPPATQRLIDSTRAYAAVSRGKPFSASALENERTRIGNLLRTNGYYYFNPNYTTFLADTFNVANRLQLRVQLADGLPPEALSQWYIGNTDIVFRRTAREQPTDSLYRRHLHIFFSGKKPPLRPRVVLKNIRLRPRRLYSYQDYLETVARVNATGVFSSVDVQFTPRERDTLDMRLTCTFDKPYDFYFETNLNGRTIGRFGPEAKVGFTRRNIFKGAEKLDVNLHGNYEWQYSGNRDMNNYQYGADVSIEFPRIIAPFVTDRPRRRGTGPQRQTFTPQNSTLAKASTDIIRRPGYYKMHVASGEWTYRWQMSPQSTHQLSPLTVKYQYMNSSTAKYDSLVGANLFLLASMSDQFIPKMRYTYTYTSPTTYRNPIRWETTLEEAGNVTALYDVVVQGNSWRQTNKTLFKNPYAQFVRIETDLTKTWQTGNSSQLVGHLGGGLIYYYGNSEETPFSEQFYVGGANSIRAFTVRSIGPGGYIPLGNKQFSYVVQNGDIKILGNLEYRTQLFGNLHGALFLDVGNVWRHEAEEIDIDESLSKDEQQFLAAMNAMEQRSVFRLSRLFDQLAVGTGFGLRYDLGFLVVRLDWGLALHLPYETSRSGYFNIDRFSDAQAFHFAIGYPF